MPSFANKVRSNTGLKSAAKSLGMKPGQVQTKQAMTKVRQEAKSRAAAATQGANTTNQNNTTTRFNYDTSTVGGNYVGSGLGIITDLMGKYPGNETIAGLGAGSIFDIGRTQANTGLAIAYNDAFLGSLGTYQTGQENLKTANASKLLAQEGAIARDLTDMTSGRQLEGLKYGADRGLEGTKYGADKGLEGLKYSSDRSLEGTKYGFDSQERQIGLTGAEERKTLTQKGLEERKMRADARGAIRSQGARFYG
jgi:hypothetical protein